MTPKFGLAAPALRKAGLPMRPAQHKRRHGTLTRDFSVIRGWSDLAANLCVSILLRYNIPREEGAEPT